MNQKDFLYDLLVHDLTGPLSVVATTADGLLSRMDRYGTLSEPQKSCLERIVRNTRKVQLIVKEILVSADTVRIRHSIPITSGPKGTPAPSGETNTPSYLLCGRSRFADAGKYGVGRTANAAKADFPCQIENGSRPKGIHNAKGQLRQILG